MVNGMETPISAPTGMGGLDNVLLALLQGGKPMGEQDLLPIMSGLAGMGTAAERMSPEQLQLMSPFSFNTIGGQGARAR